MRVVRGAVDNRGRARHYIFFPQKQRKFLLKTQLGNNRAGSNISQIILWENH